MDNNMKEFVCTGCEDMVIATKFASQKTIRCDKCKENDIPVNPEIVARALAKNPPKREVTKQTSTPTGDTKDVPCIKCGKMMTVTKFASAKKAVCDDCKGKGIKASDIEDDGEIAPREFKVNASKIDWTQIKPLEEYRVNEIIIANKNLQKVKCPACGHEHMKVLRVLDSSQFGIIATYQCLSCRLVMTISEQTKDLLKVLKPGRRFNYSGEEIEKIAIDSMDDTRLSNSVKMLLQLCKDNNIKVEGIDNPPYYYKEEKPVPVGLVTPSEDKLQYVLNGIMEGLTKAERMGNTVDEPEGSRYVQLSETLVNKIVNDIKQILKED